MKRIFVIAAALFVAVQSFAREQPGTFTIKPTVGINISASTSDHANAKLGFVGGIDFGYKLNKLITFTAGAMYSCEGWNNPDAPNESVNLNYINVPVLINFNVVKGLVLKAGLQPGFSIGGKMVAEGQTVDFRELKSLVDLSVVNLSVPIGVSYEFKNFTVEARYNAGLSPLAKLSFLAESSVARGSVFQILLGYKIPLR